MVEVKKRNLQQINQVVNLLQLNLILNLLQLNLILNLLQLNLIPGKPPAVKPSSDKPASDKPATDKPASDKPASDKPASTSPSTNTNNSNKVSCRAKRRCGHLKQGASGDQSGPTNVIYVHKKPWGSSFPSFSGMSGQLSPETTNPVQYILLAVTHIVTSIVLYNLMSFLF